MNPSYKLTAILFGVGVTLHNPAVSRVDVWREAVLYALLLTLGASGTFVRSSCDLCCKKSVSIGCPGVNKTAPVVPACRRLTV